MRKEELGEIAIKDPMIHDVIEDWEKLRATYEQYLDYESRLKPVIDEISYRNDQKRFIREQNELILELNDHIDQKNELIGQLNDIIDQQNELVAQLNDLIRQNKEPSEHSWLSAKQEILSLNEKLLDYGVTFVVIRLIHERKDLDVISNITGFSKEKITKIKHDLMIGFDQE